MLIKRVLEEEIKSKLFKGKAIILYGPRQTGKSTLINEILKSLSMPVAYLNGDDADIKDIISVAEPVKLRTIIGQNKILFIDEAQKIDNIGTAIKICTDRISDVQVIATGSSSFELASKTNEALTGRKYEFFLFPLSFNELYNHHGYLLEKRSIEQRLIFGSYPEIISKPFEAKDLVKLLAGSYLYKDIMMLEGIQKPAIFEKLLKAIALQLGSEVKYTELSQLTGINSQTVDKYIDIMEKAFIIFKLPAFSGNTRSEIKKGKKIYFYDNGIRNAVIGNFTNLSARNDTGGLWENYLVSERIKALAYSKSDKTSYFWRTTQQQEIDYIEEYNNEFNIFEFKWNPHKKSLFPKTFTDNYKTLSKKIITPDNYEEFLLTT